MCLNALAILRPSRERRDVGICETVFEIFWAMLEIKFLDSWRPSGKIHLMCHQKCIYWLFGEKESRNTNYQSTVDKESYYTTCEHVSLVKYQAFQSNILDVSQIASLE
jgi:hypothetical protein